MARPATAGELHALEAVAAEICLVINKAESRAWTCGLTGFFLPCQREASAMQGGGDVCPSAGWTVAVEPLPCGHRGRRRVLSRSGLAGGFSHHSLGCPCPFAQISWQTPTWCVCRRAQRCCSQSVYLQTMSHMEMLHFPGCFTPWQERDQKVRRCVM